jgi:hypothetical protein
VGGPCPPKKKKHWWQSSWVEIGIGVLAVGLTVASLGTGSVVLGGLAVAAGFGAGLIDGDTCFEDHEAAACAGLALGSVSVVAGVGSLATAEDTAGRALSDGLGLGTGLGAATVDGTTALVPPKECD